MEKFPARNPTCPRCGLVAIKFEPDPVARIRESLKAVAAVFAAAPIAEEPDVSAEEAARQRGLREGCAAAFAEALKYL